MKKHFKSFVILIMVAAIGYSLVNSLIVKPFFEGYEQAGIGGGLFSVLIYVLIAAGLYTLISWALD